MPRMPAIQRRGQLLDVAAELFARAGYRGTTTAELARAAGITEPILYRHFDNKRDLFVTLLDQVGEQVISVWRDALRGVADPAMRLRILLSNNPASCEHGRGVYRVIFQAVSESESDPTIARAIQQHIAKLEAFVENEVERLQEHGAVRDDISAQSIACLLVDVAIGFGFVAPLVSLEHSDACNAALQRTLNILLTTQ